jgi:hypothetical protein
MSARSICAASQHNDPLEKLVFLWILRSYMLFVGTKCQYLISFDSSRKCMAKIWCQGNRSSNGTTRLHLIKTSHDKVDHEAPWQQSRQCAYWWNHSDEETHVFAAYGLKLWFILYQCTVYHGGFVTILSGLYQAVTLWINTRQQSGMNDGLSLFPETFCHRGK